MREIQIDPLTFQVLVDDITRVAADAIVCAANSYGHMRGGVSQAIRLKGGDIIEMEARRKAPISLGSAVATSAGALDARWVLHAPTMRDPVEISSAKRIRRAASAAMRLGAALGAQSIAFPLLGSGVGEVNPQKAAAALVQGILEHKTKNGNLVLVKLVARTSKIATALTLAVEAAELST